MSPFDPSQFGARRSESATSTPIGRQDETVDRLHRDGIRLRPRNRKERFILVAGVVLALAVVTAVGLRFALPERPAAMRLAWQGRNYWRTPGCWGADDLSSRGLWPARAIGRTEQPTQGLAVVGGQGPNEVRWKERVGFLGTLLLRLDGEDCYRIYRG